MYSIIPKSLIFLCLCILTSTSFAYRIYNQMDNDGHYYSRKIYVVDTYGFSGIKAYIKNGESAACDPAAPGCSGTLHFQVMDPYDYDILCTGNFKIDKKPGNYFVVRTNRHNGPLCTITHYQDKA